MSKIGVSRVCRKDGGTGEKPEAPIFYALHDWKKAVR